MIITKLLFKATTFFRLIADKYRSGYYSHIYKKQVFIDYSVRFGTGTSVVISPGAKTAKLTIGQNTKFRKFCTVTLDAEGQLEIGANTFFNNGCSINCLHKIKIGDNTLFGEGVKIYDHNHLFNKTDSLIVNQGFNVGYIQIGNNCWIGTNTIILRGVIIGDNVVLGAGCIITESVPANTLVKANRENNMVDIVYK